MKYQRVDTYFEDAAYQHAQKTAIECKEGSITYAGLHTKAGHIAGLLSGLNIGTHPVIATFLQPGIEWVAGLLGIFKSGGIYLPMDTELPVYRTKEILTRLRPSVLITDSNSDQRLKKILEDLGMRVAILVSDKEGVITTIQNHEDLEWRESPIAAGAADRLPQTGKDGDASYIFYTSGSTGLGKPILGSHQSLSHFIQWEITEFAVSAECRVTQLARITFDASLRDVFIPLCTGGTLCIPDQEIRSNVLRLVDWIETAGISLIHCVPSLFKLIYRELGHSSNASGRMGTVKTLLMAGEPLYAKDISGWRKHVGSHIELVNLYGTSETTLAKTFHRIDELPEDEEQMIPAGKPISQTAIAIINSDHICRVGEIGEIYIKTAFCSHGYFEEPEMTRRVFVKNPLGMDTTDVVYKSGDLGRYLEDRSIEVLGRVDDQVKVNGVRLELEEMQKTILRVKEVEEALVVAHMNTSNETELVCYYTGVNADAEDIRDQLRIEHDEKIMPGYFVRLASFPLSLNGKVDKRALPRPEALLRKEIDYEPVQNDEERRLENIWKEVLGREFIGRKAEFFKIGGTSLRAIQVISRIFREFDVSLRIADIFLHPSVGHLATMIRKTQKQAYQAIARTEEQSSYELSNAQKRLWVIDQLKSERNAYNIFGAYQFSGLLNRTAFTRAFEAVVDRHESLRTIFITESGEPRQKICARKELGYRMEFIDITHETEIDRKATEISEIESLVHFDLSHGPLIRTKLVQLAGDRYVFLLTLHHIISDGWSLEVLVKEILYFYEGYSRGETPILDPLRIQYRDYAAWQNAFLAKSGLESHRAYWKARLSGRLPVLNLPTDLTRPGIKKNNGSVESVFIPGTLHEKLKAKSHSAGTTLFMVLFATVEVLLQRYTDQEDIIVGSPVAGRAHVDLEDQIGFYVNMLALRTNVGSGISFDALLEQVKEVLLGAFSHQMYPFDKLVEELDVPRDMSRMPVFDVIIGMLDADLTKKGKEEFSEIAVSGYPTESKISKYDLTFNFQELQDGVALHVEYCTDIFKKATVLRMLGHYLTIIDRVLADGNLPIGRMDFLGSEEREQLLAAFNNTEVRYPENSTVIELFESQVRESPAAIALVCEGRELSYGELNERSNQLGRWLRTRYGIRGDELVGVLADRSEWMIIGILGILKAGAGYVPIDPEYPQERKRYIIEDAGIRCLLLDCEGEEGDHNSGIVRFHDIWAEEIDKQDRTDLERINTAKDTAYVMYTSGSTGRPKGCIIKNRSLVNYLFWANNFYFQNDIDGHFGLFSSISFDFTITSIFCPLLRGKQIFIYGQYKAMNEILSDCFAGSGRADVIKLTPSHIDLLEQLQIVGTTIKLVIAGGEMLEKKHVDIIRKIDKRIVIVNEYGPTETTVGVIAGEIHPGERIVIGKPVSNTRALVLNAYMQLQPVGVEGELWVSGRSVGRGYLNREELTSERFVENPYGGEGLGHERLYRTGDRGRWLSDGTIEYLGRKDRQVKLRGYRIELGEIEEAMNSCAGIEGAVVVARGEGSDRHVVGYYRVSGGKVSREEVEGHLRVRLPGHMVPSWLVEVEQYPLTEHGKLDEGRLPDPVSGGYGRGGVGEERVLTETEEVLVRIWEEVLGGEGIGVRDNFFELGGHSIKAIQLVFQITRALSADIQLTDVFEWPTIEELGRVIEERGRREQEEIGVVEEQEDYEVSHAQKRLWIIDQLEGEKTAYNIFGSYVFEGELDRGALERSFGEVVDRHESLRTVFVSREGEPRQKILSREELGYRLKYVDLREEEEGEQRARELSEEESVRGFDLTRGPLLRTKLLRMGERRYVFLMTLHHIISDGWSMEVMVRELLGLYEGYSRGEERELKGLRIQYKDYAAWQNGLLGGEEVSSHRKYWREQLGGELPVLELPTDYHRPQVKRNNGSVIGTVLEKGVREGLQKKSQEKGLTIFMVLVAAVKILLHRYSGQEDIIVGTPTAGREHPDLEDQIGFYVNTLALRSQVRGERSIDSLLEEIRTMMVEAYAHQVYPFDRLVEELEVVRDLSRMPVFDVLVVFQNMELGGSGPDELSGIAVGQYVTESTVSKYDLTFIFHDFAEGVSLQVEYSTDLFSRERVERLVNHYRRVLDGVIADGSQGIGKMEYMESWEREQLLGAFNDTRAGYPESATVIGLFEEQVRETPDAIALVCEGRELSYGELNERSNQLGWWLRERYGIRGDDLVGILADRSEWMIIGILGILKAGAGYVPIDPEYPQERIAFMTRDAGLSIILTNAAAGINLTGLSDVVLVNLLHDKALPYQEPGRTVEKLADLSPDQLAYVMYTSGSTGEPKGAMITHRNIVSLVKGTNYYPFTRDSIVLSASSPSFDATTFDYWGMLLNGGKLVLCSEKNLLDNKLFGHQIKNNHVTGLFLTTSRLNQLVDSSLGVFAGISTILTGGEKVSENHLEKLARAYPSLSIVHVYGPTENTTFSLAYSVPENAVNFAIPIGRPLQNRKAYILDKQKQLCPMGITGEIYLGGAGVAKGYWNRPQLSEERFVQDSFDPTGQGKLYRTGDLGRWREDGNIEFIGRVDKQVKLRGFRIELDEIEKAMQSYPEVVSTVVVEKGGYSDKYLIGYFKSPGSIDDNELRKYLSNKLPVYMVPLYLIRVDAYPLTRNGKLDVSKLPDPKELEFAGLADETPGWLQAKLIDVWQEVLGKTGIGIKDNFFELGGDSIKAIQISTRMYKFGYKLEIRDLFLYSTIDELSAILQKTNIQVSSNQSVVEGEIGLTPIQHLFFRSKHKSLHHYNQSVLLYSRKGYEIAGLRRVFEEIQKHHDALRMSYWFASGGKVIQMNNGLNYPLAVDEYDIAGSERPEDQLERIANELQSNIDLSTGPLMKVALFRMRDGDRLLIVIHHLVIDGISWRILFEDFSTLYRQYQAGDPMKLPPKSDSFQIWSERLHAYSSSISFLDEKKYWKDMEETVVSRIRKDHDISENLVRDNAVIGFELSREETELLVTRVNRIYGTEINDILLAALGMAIEKTFGNHRVSVMLEGHGRENIIPGIDIKRTIGWFTTVFPIILDMSFSGDVGRQIVDTKEMLKNVPKKGIGYGILKYLTNPEKRRDISFSQQPQISFNYLGQFDTDLEKANLMASSEAQGATLGLDVVRDYDIEITGIVSGRKLGLSITYNKMHFDSLTMKALNDNYHGFLTAIISHCIAKDRKEITPSDLTYKKLSVQDLKKISNIYQK